MQSWYLKLTSIYQSLDHLPNVPTLHHFSTGISLVDAFGCFATVFLRRYLTREQTQHLHREKKYCWVTTHFNYRLTEKDCLPHDHHHQRNSQMKYLLKWWTITETYMSPMLYVFICTRSFKNISSRDSCILPSI